MEDSVFTKIINGDIPCHKIYEDATTLAFLDIHPMQPGQVVVVPKTQVSFVWDLSSEDYLSLMTTVYRVGNRLRDVLSDKARITVSIEGFDVNNHAHVVVIPANNPDEINTPQDMDSEPDHTALAIMAERLKF